MSFEHVSLSLSWFFCYVAQWWRPCWRYVQISKSENFVKFALNAHREFLVYDFVPLRKMYLSASCFPWFCISGCHICRENVRLAGILFSGYNPFRDKTVPIPDNVVVEKTVGYDPLRDKRRRAVNTFRANVRNLLKDVENYDLQRQIQNLTRNKNERWFYGNKIKVQNVLAALIFLSP